MTSSLSFLVQGWNYPKWKASCRLIGCLSLFCSLLAVPRSWMGPMPPPVIQRKIPDEHLTTKKTKHIKTLQMKHGMANYKCVRVSVLQWVGWCLSILWNIPPPQPQLPTHRANTPALAEPCEAQCWTKCGTILHGTGAPTSFLSDQFTFQAEHVRTMAPGPRSWPWVAMQAAPAGRDRHWGRRSRSTCGCGSRSGIPGVAHDLQTCQGTPWQEICH